MKHIFKKGIIGALATTMAIASAVPAVSAATNVMIDNSRKVSFNAVCDEAGYTFQLYKIGTLTTSDNANGKSPYRTGYNSLINDAAIKAALNDGFQDGSASTEKQSELLRLLEEKYNPTENGNYKPGTANANEPATDPLQAQVVANSQWTSSDSVKSHKYENLDQGVYYVRAINWPAGVTYVRNSVFALPYYDANDGWTYTIEDIPLATKVDAHPVETYKTITNTTVTEQQIPAQHNVKQLADQMHGVYQPATDVNLGDTVNFEIRSTITGSDQMKLNSYFVTDSMSNGLTLDKNSFHMYLLDKDGNRISELQQGNVAASETAYQTATKDYVVYFDPTNNGSGTKSTDFKVYLTREFLHKNSSTTKFYGTGSAQDSNAVYTSITYSAMLNDKAVVGKAGNPNTEGKIEYSNKKNVTGEYEGNTVYVYTWGVRPHKTDDSTTPKALEGAEFKLFKTKADAENLRNPIATGTSNDEGLVQFMTNKFNGYDGKATEITLQRGTYYAVETKAPTGFQTYGKVIEIKVDVTYDNQFANQTWVKSAPADGQADGYLAFTVTNTKLETPNTGGMGDYIAYYIAGGIGIVGIIGLAVALTKKRSKKIK